MDFRRNLFLSFVAIGSQMVVEPRKFAYFRQALPVHRVKQEVYHVWRELSPCADR